MRLDYLGASFYLWKILLCHKYSLYQIDSSNKTSRDKYKTYLYDIIEEKYVYNNIPTIKECKKKIIERIEREYDL